VSDNQSQVADIDVPEELKQLLVTHLEELGKSFDSLSVTSLTKTSRLVAAALLQQLI